MTFARRRADTPWAGPLDPVEMQLMDRDISRALDGYAGGTYAPSSVLTIGGAGLAVTALLDATGGIDVAGGIAADSINVTGDVLILDDLTVFDLLTVQGDSSLQGNVDVFGDLDVTGNIVAPTGEIDLLTCFAIQTGAFDANGASVFDGTVALNGATTLAADMTLSGAGKIVERVGYLANSDSTVSVATADTFIAQDSVVTATHNYTISNATVLGTKVKFMNWSSSAHQIKNQGGGNIGGVNSLPTNTLAAPGVLELEWADDGQGLRWIVAGKQAP